jgi:hypothetical protein
MPQNDLDEIKEQAAKLLNQVPQKEPLGTKLFNAVARHTVGIAFEAVLLRRKGEDIEVFLTLRENIEAYGGLWHCPGSFFRALETEKDVLKRLSQKEYGAKITSCFFCQDSFEPEERGGICLDRIYLITLKDEPNPINKGMWFNVDRLPRNIVNGHRDKIIPIAVKYFLKRMKNATKLS